jgi:hypothetical protein
VVGLMYRSRRRRYKANDGGGVVGAGYAEAAMGRGGARPARHDNEVTEAAQKMSDPEKGRLAARLRVMSLSSRAIFW